MNEFVHGGGVAPRLTERVYYIGTDTLYEGYALCYNFDALSVTAENLTLSVTESLGPTPARRLQVEKPSYANSLHFAGVVSAKSNGVVGPCWVEINKPGSVCNIYCNADTDHADSNSVNTGQILVFSTGQYYFKYAGLPGSGAAIVLQDVDRSSTAGLVLAELMTGQPCGGYNILSSLQMSAGQAVSTGGSVTKFPPVGITANNVSHLTADITAKLLSTKGMWPGQTKIFKNLCGMDANDDFIVTISGVIANTSALAALTTSNVVATMDTAAHGVMCVWDGYRWLAYPSTNGVVA